MICCRSSNICRICTSSAPLTPRILSSCRRRLGEPLPTRQTSTPRGVDFLDLSFQNSTCLLQRASHFTKWLTPEPFYNARAILHGANQIRTTREPFYKARNKCTSPGGNGRKRDLGGVGPPCRMQVQGETPPKAQSTARKSLGAFPA
jgi:hypothetical protein